MTKLYFFPPYLKKNPDTNPYSTYYKESLSRNFDVVEKDYLQDGYARFAFVKKAFLADVYVLNWIESIGKGLKNLPLFLASYLGIIIIMLRRKKIVWMFHNIHPHTGENYYTRVIQNLLYRRSKVIISHSREAQCYAETKAKCKVYYRCHPVKPISLPENKLANEFDVLIWGAILPYKGVGEFLSIPEVRNSSLRIRVIGKCKDNDLQQTILSCCNEHISFDNRFASIEELCDLCQKAKFVLFPYLPGSVSSSGALIDTIAMGGTPVGPNIGAFKDLADENVCITYENSNGMMQILNGTGTISDDARAEFLKNNSWEKFGEFVYRVAIDENNN